MLTLTLVYVKLFGDKYDRETVSEEGIGFYIYTVVTDTLNYYLISTLVGLVL